MIVVMDQMQPGYAQKYDMTNILWLQNKGSTSGTPGSATWPPRRWSATTSWSAACNLSHMGWSDEAIRDVDNVLGYGENEIVTVGELGNADYENSSRQWTTQARRLPAPQVPGHIVANVGEKGYQVESMAASSSDYWVRIGSKKKAADLADPSVVPW